MYDRDGSLFCTFQSDLYLFDSDRYGRREPFVGLGEGLLGGIEEGDTVVIKGNERLRPGQKVKPIPTNKEIEGE